MALPDGVSIASTGQKLFVTQRGYFAPPFSSCMFAALCSILTWMGYRLPLARAKADTPPDNFVLTLHEASGAGLDESTSIRHTRRALNELLPGAGVMSGTLGNEDFIEELARGAAIRVMARLSDLPRHLQQHAGSSNKGHAFCIIGTRVCNGADGGRHQGHHDVREVFWMDPMGRPSQGYKGEWVVWGDVRSVLKRRSGEIIVTLGHRDAAIMGPPDQSGGMEPRSVPGRAGGGGAGPAVIAAETAESLFGLLGFRGRVARRTPVIDPKTGAIVTHIAATDRARCLGLTPDGRHVGILVNTTKLPGPNPKVLLVDKSRVERV